MPLPPDVEAYMRNSLFENRFLPSRVRCEIIQQKFGFPLNRDRMLLAYKRMGIRYMATKTVYKAAMRRPDYRLA